MKIAVAGLSPTHPEAFATIARRMGAQIDCVWDYERAKAEACAERHAATVVSSPEEAGARRPDGAMVTCISADHGRVSLPFAVNREDLDRLCGAAHQRQDDP